MGNFDGSIRQSNPRVELQVQEMTIKHKRTCEKETGSDVIVTNSGSSFFFSLQIQFVEHLLSQILPKAFGIYNGYIIRYVCFMILRVVS